MKNLAVIPARGGSKRIPRKNIISFKGNPIIKYPIIEALKSGVFDTVMVSTDDKEIASIALKAGAKIPFYRSENASNDHANLHDVLIEVTNKYLSMDIHYDNICCILPTSPLLKAKRIIEGLEKMNNQNLDAVSGIVKYSHPVLRSLEIDKENKLRMKWPEFTNVRSQDLSDIYYDSGTFYWIKINKLLKTDTLYPNNCGGLVLDELEVQDIDTKTDLKLAELKYDLQQINNEFK